MIVTGSTTIDQTDFTPPEFTSLVIDTPEVVAGDRFRIDYVAADADSDFQQANFRFTHETTNNSIYLYDYDDDGMATYKSNADLDRRIYNLNEIHFMTLKVTGLRLGQTVALELITIKVIKVARIQ